MKASSVHAHVVANALKQFEAQVMDEEDQLRFGFDLLDPTKIVPEDIVPFTPLGKLTLNRNPRNYFAETEQIMVRGGEAWIRGKCVPDPIPVPSWPCRPGNRFYRRPATSRTPLLVPGYAAQSTQRPQL